MIAVCKSCADLRGMSLPTTQKPCKCFLCGTKAMCGEFGIMGLKWPAVTFETGVLVSEDLAKSLAQVKRRKSILLPRIKQLQVEVSKVVKEARIDSLIYCMGLLVQEGHTKKSLNTFRNVLNRMQEVLDKSKVDVSEVSAKKMIEQNLLAELSGLNETEKELSILYNTAIDRIVISECRLALGSDGFHAVFERSKKIYKERTKK